MFEAHQIWCPKNISFRDPTNWMCGKQTKWPQFLVGYDTFVIMIEAVAITRDWLELHRYERRSDENYVPGYEFAGTVVYASSSAGKAHVGKQVL